MNPMFITLSEIQPIFQLFAKLLVLFVFQELLSKLLSKFLSAKNVPVMVNLTVYTSFAIIIVWYINQYVFTHFSRFVQIFLR